jgi:acetyltransferase
MSINSMPLWELTLEGKTQVVIRPITINDIQLEKEFFDNLSQNSKHDRFLGGITKLSSKALKDFCSIDYLHNMAFVAVIKGTFNENIIGIVRYVEDSNNSKNAEIAITVDDDWQNKGIGTELLKRLMEFAKNAGINKLYSIDSYANRKMKVFAKELGFSKKNDPDDASLVIYEIDIRN